MFPENRESIFLHLVRQQIKSSKSSHRFPRHFTRGVGSFCRQIHFAPQKSVGGGNYFFRRNRENLKNCPVHKTHNPTNSTEQHVNQKSGRPGPGQRTPSCFGYLGLRIERGPPYSIRRAVYVRSEVKTGICRVYNHV